MIYDRKLTVDFYSVRKREPEQELEFEDLLARILKLSLNERNAEVKAVPFRLQNGGDHKGSIEGNMVKIRLDEQPSRADLRGQLAPFEMEETEGVAEETAFLFHRETRTLLLQYNHYGCSATALIKYFLAFVEMGEGKFYFDPKLSNDELARLQRMKKFTRFDVTVAGGDGAILEKAGYGLGSVRNFVRRAGAPRFSITVTGGHSEEGLNKSFIKEAANKFLGIHDEIEAEQEEEAQAIAEGKQTGKKPREQIVGLHVGGRDEHALDELPVINLLQGRMREPMRFKAEGRVIAYPARQQALRGALDRRLKELRASVGLT